MPKKTDEASPTPDPLRKERSPDEKLRLVLEAARLSDADLGAIDELARRFGSAPATSEGLRAERVHLDEVLATANGAAFLARAADRSASSRSAAPRTLGCGLRSAR